MLCIMFVSLGIMSCGSTEPSTCEIVCSHRWGDGTENYFKCLDVACSIKDQADSDEDQSE